MGPRLRLPRYVHGFIDRHGKPRFYFRRAGFGSRPLRGSLYSSQFMDDYEAALAGQSLPIGADRARPGTIAIGIELFCIAAIWRNALEQPKNLSRHHRTVLPGTR